MKKYTRKVVKNSQGTYYFSLPKDIIRKLNIQDRQKLNVYRSGKKIVIEDWE